MSILLGVDGTGPYSDSEYHHEMHNSFVSYILATSGIVKKRYIRGPGKDGVMTAHIAQQGYDFVRQYPPQNRPVVLTGYSRGGAAVIAVAQKLKRIGIRVEGMMLFDAVDRAPFIDTSHIPNNVSRVVHVRRDPRYLSREIFGNCGTIWAAPTVYGEAFFPCTHGAVGGVHWRSSEGRTIVEPGEPYHGTTYVTPEQDLRGARRAWAWAHPRLVQMGFFVDRH